MSQYTLTVTQNGPQATSVMGDHTQLLTGSGAVSVQDVLQILQAMRTEVERLDLPVDRKEDAKGAMDRAITQATQAEPDKSAVTEQLKSVADIVKSSSTIAVGVTQFWELLRKALEWAAV